MQEFDYVIVGAGAAGCVLAHRLSENPAVSVALIEAGGSDNHPFIRMPKGFAKIWRTRRVFGRILPSPKKATPFKRTKCGTAAG